MKKLLLSLTFVLLTLASVRAQEGPPGVRSSTDYAPGTTESRNNGFGVKGGWNISNVHGDNKNTLSNRDNLNNFMAGIYAQFALNNKFSVQPEFLYSRKGYRLNKATLSADSTVRLDYLQIPVLLVYNFLDNVSVHVGPQVSLLANINRDLSISAAGLHSLDYGVVGGLEARIGPARLGARYDLGLAKIYKTSILPAGNKVYNQTLQVYLGLGFSQ
ncbi:porin family protein [Hymenobacter cavernae]|uniref:Outer membrane protein beta-barrel domain-containing protein n=1 Tax=Hymenobacter cavernae TaxID=2044852 RepID=A0ABQ1TNG0_9BACT|nr:porin family protein [Hymenobacter cavernae]GGE99865.1 hypothetical protein GCM10011383_08440 [Hymenobacter cavernae]